MINLNYNGIKNTLISFSLLNINIGKKVENKKVVENKISENNIILHNPKDYKTTLGGTKINLIDKMIGNLSVYLFIEKEKENNFWNMVVPVIIEKNTNKMYQYKNGCFALEGSGGGLSNTSSIIRYLKLHTEKGYNVSIAPKVIENELLNNFNFIDSQVNLDTLIEKSTDLILYRKNEFEWIYFQYEKLISEFKL